MRTPDSPGGKIVTGRRAPGGMNISALPNDMQCDIWEIAYRMLGDYDWMSEEDAVYRAVEIVELKTMYKLADALQEVANRAGVQNV